MSIISSENVELESFSDILSTNISSIIITYLDRQSILNLSITNKPIRQVLKKKLFSKMVFIPGSITRGIKLTKHGCVNISKENQDQLEDVFEKYHSYTKEFTISYFNCDIWPKISPNCINLKYLTLKNVKLSQESLITLIGQFTNLEILIIEHFSMVRWNNSSEIEINNLPNSLSTLQLCYNSSHFYRVYRIIDLLNTHSNLKYLRVEHERLLERLLYTYISLEHLVIRLSSQTAKLQRSFSNLPNLRTLDLLYPSLTYSMIESILSLPSLEELRFNCKIDLFNNDVNVIICPQLKQLALRSSISPEWTKFFLNSCPNIFNFKLVYSENSPIVTQSELLNQIKHLTITNYTSETFGLQALLLSPFLQKLELIVPSLAYTLSSEFFAQLNSVSNWKNTKVENRIVLYKPNQS